MYKKIKMNMLCLKNNNEIKTDITYHDRDGIILIRYHYVF